MASDRENESLSNQDIEEDAQQESGTTEVEEHYDVAIVYAGNNKETALDIMDEMSEIVLKNGDKPKVCLYSDPKCAASEIAAGEEITKICTLIFVLVTLDLHKDTVAQLIKDEAIGNTRLANSCHPDLKYSVRPLYIEKNRDYKAPCGLSTIQSVDWYEKDSRFFKRSIKILLEDHMQYRKKRERAMKRQNSERTRRNTDQYSMNHLEPEQLQFPPSIDENKNLNYMVSENSAWYTPTISHSVEPNNPNISQSNTLKMSREGAYETRNSEVINRTSHFVPSTIQSVDSGRGSILSRTESANPVSVPVSESCGPSGDDGRQTNKVPQSLSVIPQSSGSHGSGSFESRSHGFDAPISDPRTSGDRSGIIMAERNPQNETNVSEEAGTNSSSKPSTSSQTSEEETDGSFLIQSDLTQRDVVEDASMTSRRTTESQDTQSAEDSSLVARCPPENNGTKIVSSQTSHELLKFVQSASSSNESVTTGPLGEHDTYHKDIDNNRPEINSGQDSSRELILKHYGAAHRRVARCAAPNDEYVNEGKTAPAAVSPQPMVVHYHNHYHGDARGSHGFPPPPGAPPPNMASAGMPGPTFEQPAERPQQTTSGNQGNLRLRSEGPINIVNCAQVQIGMNQMEVRGTLPEVSVDTTTDNDDQPIGIGSVPADPPPAYSLEDPGGIGTVSSYLDNSQRHERSSSTLLKQTEQPVFKSPQQTDLDEMSVGCLKEDKMQTDKEGGEQDTHKIDASAHLEFPSNSSSLQSVVTRDGSQDSFEAMNEETGLCSLPVPELGSPDDMKKILKSLSEGCEDQHASKEKSVSGPSDFKLQPCRLFCKHRRRQDMFVDIGRRMVAAGGPCVGPGGHDSDID